MNDTIDEKSLEIEEQISEHRKLVDYNMLEYPVEVIVNKYLIGRDDDENEIFVPQYQRDFVWDEIRQSKFIESLFLGLPIPFLFVADVTGENEGRLEIVDGSQRIRTLANFTSNGLVLSNLKKLDKLNGLKYADLTKTRQMRFMRTNIKMIQLTEKADDEVRNDIFERINTGSDILRDMEVRRGSMPGPFSDLVRECSENALFKELTPVSARLEKRQEKEELVLRFFAYYDNAEAFDHSVREFVNEYLSKKNSDGFDGEEYKKVFIDMLTFIQKTIPIGFRKTVNAKSTPRVRFETLAVGAAKALEKNPNLICKNIEWMESDDFKNHTRSDGSNSKTKLVSRINYTKNKFLGK